MPMIDAPNINQLWAQLLVEELVRCGVSGFVLSPGSRSTPLTLAVAQHPTAPRIMHYDERGAGFYALGRAKALGKPVALICTSGSAAANYWPAVVEAAAVGAPLLLLTSDRPPELLHCGANQAIDQVRLFGNYVCAAIEMPCPDDSIPAAYVLATANDAVRRAELGGPVHINCMFREPLAPTPDGLDARKYLSPVDAWLENELPYTTHHHPTSLADDAALPGHILQGNGAILAGELRCGADRAAAVALAEALGWPLLPDFTSGLRMGNPSPNALPHYDALLLSETFQKQFRPETVIHLGGRIVSKRLLQHLGRIRPRLIHVDAQPDRQDANHQVNMRVQADVAAWCARQTAAVATPLPYVQRFRDAEAAVAQVLHAAMRESGALAETSVAGCVAEERPPGSLLFVGNSLPIREFDTYAPTSGAAGVESANRGASGIDGNIATAAGFADALGTPATLVVGDLTTLHDLNSLALLRGRRKPTAVVVINNDGGGIFSFLPVADATPHFEPYFGTPHGMSFEHAARQFGLEYARPRNMDAFKDEYRHAMEEECATVIEVVTRRDHTVAAQRVLQSRLAEAVDAAL